MDLFSLAPFFKQVPFLQAWYGVDWTKKAPSSLLWFHSYGFPSADTPKNGEPQQVVVLSQILASKVTVGYSAGTLLIDYIVKPLYRTSKQLWLKRRPWYPSFLLFPLSHQGAWCCQVNSFQGRPIANLRELADMVETELKHFRKTQSIQAVTSANGNEASPSQPTAIEDNTNTASESSTASTASGNGGSSEGNTIETDSDKLQEKGFLRFDVGEQNVQIILDIAEVLLEDANIMKQHGIASSKSADLT